MRHALLNSSTRYQAISEREDHSDIPIEGFSSLNLGKYLIHHRGCICVTSSEDMTIAKELLALVRPATVIELGTLTGGNALWLADTLLQEGIEGSVYSMDINTSLIQDRVKELKPDNLHFLQGDSNKIGETFTDDFLKSLPHPWVIVEDCHVNLFGILEHFVKYMKTGDYYIVEDTNPHTHSGVGGERLNPKFIPCGTEKLEILKKFLIKYEEKLAIDSYFTDFFGYNGTWNWHGYIRHM